MSSYRSQDIRNSGAAGTQRGSQDIRSGIAIAEVTDAAKVKEWLEEHNGISSSGQNIEKKKQRGPSSAYSVASNSRRNCNPYGFGTAPRKEEVLDVSSVPDDAELREILAKKNKCLDDVEEILVGIVYRLGGTIEPGAVNLEKPQ